MILAGDIGGTKTRLAFFEENKKSNREERFSSSSYPSLISIIEEFLEGEKIDIAVFGIAGPVKNNICKATNLPWQVDGNKVADHFSIPSVHLINDLLANAYGIRALKEEEFYCLQKGNSDQIGNQGLVSAGTGLGEAGFIWDGKDHIPFACEGGHCDFAPKTEEEIELLRSLQKKYEHVSYERLVSGQGIENIYSFFIEEKKMTKLSGQVTPKEITASAKNGENEAATKTLELFLSIYGAEAGNVALKFLTFGGIFLGGGILPKLIDFIHPKIFLKSFSEKGRFQDVLQSIPIKVVLNEKTALLGALEYAFIKK